MNNIGVLLVRRVRWWAEKLSPFPRRAAIALSEDDLARAYRGVDGRPWPEELELKVPRDHGLAPVEYWSTLVEFAKQQARSLAFYDVVAIDRNSRSTCALSAGFDFLGFDFGYYHDEYSVYSSIYHEALHSPVERLREYAARLNDSLLFSSIADVDAYQQEREALKYSGLRLEEGDCNPIAIFGK